MFDNFGEAELSKGPESIQNMHVRQATEAAVNLVTGKHSIFGKVEDAASKAVVDAIATTPTAAGDRPVEPVVIESVELSGDES